MKQHDAIVTCSIGVIHTALKYIQDNLRMGNEKDALKKTDEIIKYLETQYADEVKVENEF